MSNKNSQAEKAIQHSDNATELLLCAQDLHKAELAGEITFDKGSREALELIRAANSETDKAIQLTKDFLDGH
jgi:hypothetical protein